MGNVMRTKQFHAKLKLKAYGIWGTSYRHDFVMHVHCAVEHMMYSAYVCLDLPCTMDGFALLSFSKQEQCANVRRVQLIVCVDAVYKEMPWHLKEQMAEAMAHVKAHPEACPSDIPVR